jgi:hypothetical protein
MQIEPRSSHSQPASAEWLGGRVIIEKWLGRLCARESLLQFASGAVLMIVGLVVIALTYLGMVFFLFRNWVTGMDLVWFATLAIAFLVPSFAYAYRTRWGSEAVTKLNFGSPLSSTWYLIWEILSAGPIFVILAAQDFQKYARLSRLDIRPVSALLLWLFDKGGRASFAEISLAFPGLNIVRVLPQLRDVPGIYWWPDEGRISLGQSLRDILTGILHRDPPHASPFTQSPPRPPHFAEPPPAVADETLSWYVALNLPPFATLQQVKVRYRKLAKIYHPDARARNSSVDPAASDEQMKRINEAYHNILKHSQNHAGGFD